MAHHIIAVIKFGGDESMDKAFKRRAVQKLLDPTQVANVHKGRLADCEHVGLHGCFGVHHHADIPGGGRSDYLMITYMERR